MRTFFVLGVFFTILLAGARPLSAAEEWPRVTIGHSGPRKAVLASLDSAMRWLEDGRCQTLLSEFRDERGRPLAERLGQLGMSCENYFRVILFRDGSFPNCGSAAKILAFTAPGSRVVFICARYFERTWRDRPELATAVVIHEALHTLGLGENPPSSRSITERVLAVCAR
jgi:hypothetical protein